jgi:hypothetical protein
MHIIELSTGTGNELSTGTGKKLYTGTGNGNHPSVLGVRAVSQLGWVTITLRGIDRVF